MIVITVTLSCCLKKWFSFVDLVRVSETFYEGGESGSQQEHELQRFHGDPCDVTTMAAGDAKMTQLPVRIGSPEACEKMQIAIRYMNNVFCVRK